MPVRIAIVGTEESARSAVEALLSIDEARLVGVCANTKSATDFSLAESLARRGKARAFRDVASLLKAEKPDALCVFAPSGKAAKAQRDAQTLAVLNGIDLFLSPPFAPSLEAAQKLLQSATQNRARLWISHRERFGESAEAARKTLSHKAQTPTGAWGSWKIEGDWLQSSTRLCGLLRFLLGEVKTVYARQLSSATTLNFEFANGVLGAFVLDAHSENCLHFALGNGRIEWRDLSIEIRRGTEMQRIEYSRSASREELRVWLQSVQSGRRTLQKSTSPDALQTLRVALAIQQSIKTNKPVRLN